MKRIWNRMFLERVPVCYRLSAAFAFSMSLILGCVFLVIFNVLEHQLYDSVDTALLSNAKTLEEHKPNPKHILQQESRLAQSKQNFSLKPMIQIINISGEIQEKSQKLQLTLPLSVKAISRGRLGLFTFETFDFKDRASLRQISIPIFEEGVFTGNVIQVASSLKQITNTLQGIALILWFLLPSSCFVAFILGLYFTRRSLKPVVEISKTAQQLSIEDLSIRLNLPAAKDELRAVSKAFNNMLDRLEDAVKRLRRFTGDVSHELRTPLAVILGEIELALMRPRDEEYYKTTLRSVQTEAGYMANIVEDLLLLARVESKAIACNKTLVDTKEFIDTIHRSILSIFEKKQIKFEQCIEELPNFICARGYLLLAIKNILLNAIKHSCEHSTITLLAKSQKNQAIISITDEGEGIPEEALTNIFDPFFRVDSARNRASGGIGLGLSLTLALIKLHDGSIDVFSSVGKGTTFVLKIPQDENAILETEKSPQGRVLENCIAAFPI